MGADIHWIIERQHQDGAWEAAISQTSSRHAFGGHWWDSEYMNSPQALMGVRNYTWFGLLSEVRGAPLPTIGYLARPGLPEDASKFVCRSYADDVDLHSHGWFTRADMDDWTRKIETEGLRHKDDRFSDALHSVVQYRDILDTILSGAGKHPAHVDNILIGQEYDEDGVPLPGLAAESAHEKLQRMERITQLLPVSPQTVRVIVAYDS